MWQELAATEQAEPFKNTQSRLLHWDSTSCCTIQAFVSSKKMFSKYFVTMTVQPWTQILPLVTPEKPREANCAARLSPSPWATRQGSPILSFVIPSHLPTQTKAFCVWATQRNAIVCKGKMVLWLGNTKHLSSRFSFIQGIQAKQNNSPDSRNEVF